MNWLSNIYDPTRHDAKSHVARIMDQTMLEAWDELQNWLKGKVIGPPKETESYTEAQLRKMGMVGVYVEGPYSNNQD